MSLKSESREITSVDERSSSGANSVTSEDSSERTTKRSEVPRNTLKYSYEFLLKLQKSKLSKKPPDCLERLRQECILRETWRSDRDKDSERDTEFPAALTKPPPSFRGGCKVDKAVLSDTPNPGSNSVKKSAASKGERRVGSGRLGSYNKDRESDYGYPQERSRRLFDHQGHEPLKRSNGRYIEIGSSRGGPPDDEPEWFTEGPTSQTDTIELGGFEDKNRKVRTPSPSEAAIIRKPAVSVVSQRAPPPKGIDLLKELYDMSSSTQKNLPISFEQFFGSNDNDAQNVDVESSYAPQAGSRFMSKVFAKTFDDEVSPASKPASPPTHAKEHETSPRPVLDLLENSKESSSSVSSLLRDMYPEGENRSAVSAAAPAIGPAPAVPSSFDPLEELLSRSSHNLSNGQLVGAAGAPKAAATTPSSNNVLDVEKGVQGKNIIELLLSGANVVNAPSTPHFAKSVEELEADLKMESRRSSEAMFASAAATGAANQPLVDGRSMMAPVMGNGAMERSLSLMGELQSGGHYGPRHPSVAFMAPQPQQPPAPQQQQQQQRRQQSPPQQTYQQSQPQQQQQANTTHNSASLDIMRLLMEGNPMPERDQGKPYKQDVRNVPTSVLLQDKHVQRKSGLQAGGPRPIVKSNKNPPPCLPPTPSSVETGEDLLQRLFQQQQHEQQFAHQYQQHPQHLQQQQQHHHPHHHHHHPHHHQPPPQPQQQHQQQQQQQPQPQLQEQRYLSYYGGAGGGGGSGAFNGNSFTSQKQQHQAQHQPQYRAQHPQPATMGTSLRALTGSHGQRFAQGPPLATPYGSAPMNNSHGGANMVNSSPETSILSPDDALAKWFGNLSCNQPSLPVPTNVLRVEELERQNNGHRLHQAKPTVT